MGSPFYLHRVRMTPRECMRCVAVASARHRITSPTPVAGHSLCENKLETLNIKERGRGQVHRSSSVADGQQVHAASESRGSGDPFGSRITLPRRNKADGEAGANRLGAQSGVRRQKSVSSSSSRATQQCGYGWRNATTLATLGRRGGRGTPEAKSAPSARIKRRPGEWVARPVGRHAEKAQANLNAANLNLYI